MDVWAFKQLHVQKTALYISFVKVLLGIFQWVTRLMSLVTDVTH